MDYKIPQCFQNLFLDFKIYFQFLSLESQQNLYNRIMINSSLKKSFLVPEEHKYVKIGSNGETQVINESQIKFGYSYRKVHFAHDKQWMHSKMKKQVFRDPEFQIDERQLRDLDPNNGRIVVKRLYELYRQFPHSQRPNFFPKNQISVNKESKNSFLPPFITQIGIFPGQHYKSLFLTQDFSQNGLYVIVINENGRFKTSVVDDFIPIYEKTLQPIWGLSFEESWKIILLKFWAKFNGGYQAVKKTNAFQFIQYFTNSNWKYYNLTIDGLKFLNFNQNKQDVGKYIVKTKNTQSVYEAGLIPNCAGYQVMGIKKIPGKDKEDKKNWVLLVRSTLINKWAGTLSVLDKQINNLYNPELYSMTLQRDFIVNGQDFLNLFAAAFVCSRRQATKCFSQYHVLKIEAETKNAAFLQFTVNERGYFDYCIKQFTNNKVTPISLKSRYRAQNQNKMKMSQNKNLYRYLKCKFALIKVNEQKDNNNENDHFPLKYQSYDINYSHGYNRGDARFINIVPGKYLLRIKLEKNNNPAHLVINYASKQQIKMKQIQLQDEEKSLVMRQTLASLIPEVGHFFSKSSNRIINGGQQVTFAETFEEIGYAFVGVRLKKTCPYSVLIEVNPDLLKKEGLGLKAPFKGLEQTFSIRLNPGETTAIVLKRKEQKYNWHPKGIKIFRQSKKN